MITDQQKACESILNQKLKHITVTTDGIILLFEQGKIEITGTDFEAQILVRILQ